METAEQADRSSRVGSLRALLSRKVKDIKSTASPGEEKREASPSRRSSLLKFGSSSRGKPIAGRESALSISPGGGPSVLSTGGVAGGAPPSSVEVDAKLAHKENGESLPTPEDGAARRPLPPSSKLEGLAGDVNERMRVDAGDAMNRKPTDIEKEKKDEESKRDVSTNIKEAASETKDSAEKAEQEETKDSEKEAEEDLEEDLEEGVGKANEGPNDPSRDDTIDDHSEESRDAPEDNTRAPPLTPPKSSLGMMDLPAEIRIKIWHLAAQQSRLFQVVGINPVPTDDEETPLPRGFEPVGIKQLSFRQLNVTQICYESREIAKQYVRKAFVPMTMDGPAGDDTDEPPATLPPKHPDGSQPLEADVHQVESPVQQGERFQDGWWFNPDLDTVYVDELTTPSMDALFTLCDVSFVRHLALDWTDVDSGHFSYRTIDRIRHFPNLTSVTIVVPAMQPMQYRNPRRPVARHEPFWSSQHEVLALLPLPVNFAFSPERRNADRLKRWREIRGRIKREWLFRYGTNGAGASAPEFTAALLVRKRGPAAAAAERRWFGKQYFGFEVEEWLAAGLDPETCVQRYVEERAKLRARTASEGSARALASYDSDSDAEGRSEITYAGASW